MTVISPARSTSIGAHHRLSFAGAVRSELIKLVSLRSMVALLLSILVFGLGVSAALGLTLEGAGIPDQPSPGLVLDTITIGTVLFGQLAAGILGALVMSTEYASGTIQRTLTAAPSRGMMISAKAVVLFCITTATALISLFGSWALTYPMFSALGLGVGLSHTGLAFALFGGAVFVGLCSLFGLGVGALVRSTAGGVATVISLLLLLPIVLSVLPASQAARNIHLLSLSKAGDSMASLGSIDGGFLQLADGYVSAPAGWIIATVWAAFFLTLGAIRLRKDS